MKGGTMKLILVRHGEANPSDVDPKRRLSARGIRQAELAGEFISNLGLVPDVVFASVKARSIQTAEIICEKIGLSKSSVITSSSFAPEGGPEEMGCEVASAGGDCVLLVGHMPSVARYASFLITTPKEGFANIAFDNCQVVLLTGERPDRAGDFLLDLSYPAGNL